LFRHGKDIGHGRRRGKARCCNSATIILGQDQRLTSTPHPSRRHGGPTRMIRIPRRILGQVSTGNIRVEKDHHRIGLPRGSIHECISGRQRGRASHHVGEIISNTTQWTNLTVCGRRRRAGKCRHCGLNGQDCREHWCRCYHGRCRVVGAKRGSRTQSKIGHGGSCCMVE
jgi:hypothetical protein